MKNLFELKEPVLILEKPFQILVLYLLTNHCWWLHVKWYVLGLQYSHAEKCHQTTATRKSAN